MEIHNKQLEQWEDPARAWIDLVTACQIKNREQIQACMDLACASHWTHEDWTEATNEPSSTEEAEEDFDGDIYPAAQEDWHSN